MANEFDEDAFLDELGERAQRMAAGAFLKERILERTDTCCLDGPEDAPHFVARWAEDVQSLAEGLEKAAEDPRARRRALWDIAGAALAALAMDGAVRDGAESEDVEPTVEELVESGSESFANSVLSLAPAYLGEKEYAFTCPEGTEGRVREEEMRAKVGKQITDWWGEYKAERAGTPDRDLRAGFDPWLRAKAKEYSVPKLRKRYASPVTRTDDASKYAAVDVETADPDTLQRCADAYQGFLDQASDPAARAQIAAEAEGGEPAVEELVRTVRERLARCRELLAAKSP
jgi:hypothetical protein